MLKAKIKDESAVTIPKALGNKLDLKDGDVLKVKTEKGHLVLVKVEGKLSSLMEYAGIWEDEKAEKVFKEIRKGWKEWEKSLPA